MPSTDLLPIPDLPNADLAKAMADEHAKLGGHSDPKVAAALAAARAQLTAERTATLEASKLNLIDEPRMFECCGAPDDVFAALDASVAKDPLGALAAGKMFARGTLGSEAARVGCSIRTTDGPDGSQSLTVSLTYYPVVTE